MNTQEKIRFLTMKEPEIGDFVKPEKLPDGSFGPEPTRYWCWVVAGKLFVHGFKGDEEKPKARLALMEYVKGLLPKPKKKTPKKTPCVIEDGGELP